MPATPELWRDLEQINDVDAGPGGNDQYDPKVVHLANGNILIAWVSNTNVNAGAFTGNDIIGKIYDSRGNLVKSEFHLNGTFSNDEEDFDLAALPSGGFVVAYVDDNGGTDRGIKLTEWNATGTVSNNVIIASDTSNNRYFRNPNVEVASNSSVLVTYENVNQNNNNIFSDANVISRVYNSTTNTVNPSQNTLFFGSEGTGQGVSGSDVAALSNSTYAVVFGDNNNPSGSSGDDIIYVQRLNSSGGDLGLLIDVSSGIGRDFNIDPHVVGLNGGGFVVVWENAQADGGGTRVSMKGYNNSGVQQFEDTVVNTTGAGNQSNAVVAALTDGGFVIAWIDENTRDIHGQRYDSSGATVGFEFDIDTDILNGLARDLDIEGLDDGRFVVTWEEAFESFPVQDFDVRAKIFDPRDMENSPNDYTTDQIIGTIGNDIINVEADDDRVYGWDGNDRLLFHSTATDITFDDIFDGGTGFDTIEIAGTNTLAANFQNATVSRIEKIWLGNRTTAIFNADQLGNSGLATNLLVRGTDVGPFASETTERLQFIMGSDSNFSVAGFTFQTWYGTQDSIVIIGDGSSETITGSSQTDRIHGNSGNDIIYGGDGRDILEGGVGNDTINGGEGDDTLDGGAGFDTINGGADNDMMIGSLHADTMDGGSGIDTADFSGAPNAQKINLVTNVNVGGFAHGDTLLNIENVIGSDTRGDDITGTAGDNVISGMGADDRLRGHHGDDILHGGEGNDFLYGGNGADWIFGGDGLDWVMYNGLTTGVTVDLTNIDGNGHGSGGQAEGDIYASIERVRGSLADDVITGNTLNNRLLADLGNDELYGMGGRDDLRGGGGNDIINGGAGKDSLRGGAGNDTFIYENASAHDFIIDFENNIDTINIDANLYGGGLTATQVVNTYMHMQTATRFYFDFGGGDVLHVLSGGALALTDFYDDVTIV